MAGSSALRKLSTWAAPLFISLYFLALTWRAVYTYFTPDDLLNLYQSWWSPLARLIKANLLFFEPSRWPRPLASLWLRSIYSIAGFHPAPFKALNLAILVANIFLTYAVARRLARSRTAGALTALAVAYQGSAVHLYFDTGYIFDVLCYFFYFSAVVVYLRAREEQRFPTLREGVSCCVLYICALNSKEIAVTLPAFLLIYELLYHGSPHVTARMSGASLREEILAAGRRWAGVLSTGAIALAVLGGRILHGSLMQESAYKPAITWARFMETSLRFAGELFLNPGSFTTAKLVSLWAAMLAIALLSRSRALRLAWLFLMLSPLPVAFIDPRGVAQYYVPLFGWALYAGVLLDLIFSWILRLSHPANPARTRIYASTALLAGLTLLLYPLWKSYRPDQPASVFLEAEDNRSTVRQLRRIVPAGSRAGSGNNVMRPGARLLFLDDPIHPDWFNLTFLVRLLYRDRSIVIYRAKPDVAEAERPPEAINPATLATYDRVFDYRGGYFRELSAPWNRGPIPAVVLKYGQPEIFHADWTPLDRGHPARAGEKLILKAMDLGDTLPRLEPGRTFPQEPLAQVVTDVRARFYGMPTEVETKVGWPGETNRYRVDIRVPDRVPSGLLWLDLSANGIAGPGIEIPVQ